MSRIQRLVTSYDADGTREDADGLRRVTTSRELPPTENRRALARGPTDRPRRGATRA